MSVEMKKLILPDVNGQEIEFEIVDNAARGDILKITNFVTPEMFGAIGNGVVDDTTALQTAINTGKPVYLSKQYAISSHINAQGYIFGNENCLIKPFNEAERMDALFIHAGDLYLSNVNFDLACTVAVAESDYPNIYNVGIKSNDVNYVLHVDHCTFNNVYMSAIECGYSYGEIIITNCSFLPASGNSVFADYIRFYSSNSNNAFMVNHCIFKGLRSQTNNYCGIYMATLNNRKAIVIEDNCFESMGRKGNHRLAAIDCYGLVHNVTIRNNTIYNSVWNAIRLHTTDNTVVENNYITLDTSLGSISEYAILISNAVIGTTLYDVKSVIVKNNVIIANGSNDLQVGIQIYTPLYNGEIHKIENCILSGNDIKGNIIDDIRTNAACDKLIISNNCLNENKDYAIYIDQDDYTDSEVIVDNNEIDGKSGIYYRENGTGKITIKNNKITSSTGYCINATGTPAIILSNLLSGFNGSYGGSIAGFNNVISISGTVAIGGATKSYQNYKDGTAL